MFSIFKQHRLNLCSVSVCDVSSGEVYDYIRYLKDVGIAEISYNIQYGRFYIFTTRKYKYYKNSCLDFSLSEEDLIKHIKYIHKQKKKENMPMLEIKPIDIKGDSYVEVLSLSYSKDELYAGDIEIYTSFLYNISNACIESTHDFDKGKVIIKILRDNYNDELRNYMNDLSSRDEIIKDIKKVSFIYKTLQESVIQNLDCDISKSKSFRSVISDAKMHNMDIYDLQKALDELHTDKALNIKIISGKENTLSELLRVYETEFRESLNDGVDFVEAVIVLTMNIKNGDTEYVSNFNVGNKIEYIKNAYTEDLHLKSCEDIYIKEFSFRISRLDPDDYKVEVGEIQLQEE